MKEKKKRKKGFIDYLLTVLIIVCLGTAAFSGYKMISTMLNYKEARDEYAAIEKSAVVKNETASAESTEKAYGTNMEQDKKQGDKSRKEKAPLTVEHKLLKEQNPDYVGWLYIEALPNISYPIMHGETNDTYLHTTFKGEGLFAGSIFIDAENNVDLNDPNTIIYGHNMKDDSMFGVLQTMLDAEKYKESPYIWIMTENGDYKYKIFSMYFCSEEDDTYKLFNKTDDVKEYFDTMKSMSAIDFGDMKYSKNSKCITLSTCVYADGPERFVVQAFRLNEKGEISNGQNPGASKAD